jgi:plastocyanin
MLRYGKLFPWLPALVSTRRALGVLGLVMGLGGAALAGCFSEHAATTAAVEGSCSFPLGEDVPGSTIVVIQDFTFQPADLQVLAGGRVTWINCDTDSHTSTADGGQWSSPLLAPGDRFTQTFPTPGEFPYHCQPHPFMTGRVVVT